MHPANVFPACLGLWDVSDKTRRECRRLVVFHIRKGACHERLDRLQEIARRIVHGVDEAYEVVQTAKQDDVVVKHQHAVLRLPQRIVTEAEYQSCKAEAERLKAHPGDGRGNWNARVVAPYEKLAAGPHPTAATPVNVLRIGDTVICTNQFELYTDFGVQMKARSKAVQTFVVQLANGAAEPQPPADAPEDDTNDWLYASSGTYLPSKRATKGGGYGAVVRVMWSVSKAGRCSWKKRSR